MDPIPNRPIKFCVITAQASTIQALYRGQLEYLTRHGFAVTAVAAPTEPEEEIRARGIHFHPVPMARRITPFGDLIAIFRLWRFLRRERFDLVQVCTPKGAFVGAIAAWLARAPVSVHLLRGLAYQRRGFLSRCLLKPAVWVASALSDFTIAISHELRNMAIADHLCKPKKITVLGHGSSNGVDLERFSPARRAEKEATRARLKIPADALVVGFVGRLLREKGIVELITAFRQLRERHDNLYLLLLGTYEPWNTTNALPPDVMDTIERDPHCRRVEWQPDPIPYYAAMDILAFPTYREGFGNVAIEAAALGIPAVASDTLGCREGTLHEQTGLLIKVGDAAALAAALERLIVDEPLRRRFGEQGRVRVERDFDCRKLWPLYIQEYHRLLKSKGLLPAAHCAKTAS